MRRILVFNRLGTALGEIDPNDVLEATMREEINGEHSLEIVTTQVLEKGTRLLHEDGRGRWREFAVAGVDAEHAAGVTAVGTYYCPWSIQEDLMGVTVSVMPGVQTPVQAGVALAALLSTQERWAVGTVTNTATGGASMYDRSAWDALSTLIDVWGGEIDVTISVSTVTGVITRAVDLYAQQGDQSAKRRFDFGADLSGIIRTLPDEPLYCRISPRGKGEETDAGGYGRKITIESVNDGKDYLEYAPMVDAAKLPNGSSGYTYPTKIVENGDIETPAELKTWAQSILEAECTPDIGYEIDVLQSDEAGTSVQGVSLGDAVHVVDGSFGGGGLRVEARVTSIMTDLVGERVDTVELGMQAESISSKFENASRAVSKIANQMSVMSTAQYVSELLDRINTEINATGGYTYITEGQGLRTYDVAVSDPLVGSEASMVVEIKGGNIRIANSKTSQGEWEWKTVLQSGHILAELVTAAQLTTGYIGSAGSGNYWNLDTGEFRMASTGYIGDTTVDQLITTVDNIGVRNLSPFFSADFSDVYSSSNQGAYWRSSIPSEITQVANGWAHVQMTNQTSSSAWKYVYVSASADEGITNANGTLLIEIKNFETTSENLSAVVIYSCRVKVASGSTSRYFSSDQNYYVEMTYNASYTGLYWFEIAIATGGSGTTSFDIRLSYYEGEYDGEYRTYTAQLDETQVRSIANETVDAQTQTFIFNKLTNNGALQGLFMQNGNLYMNASYIKTGYLNANLITSGKIQSANGKVYFDLTNNTLVCDKMVSTTISGITADIGREVLNGSYYDALKVYNTSSPTYGIMLRPGDSSNAPELVSISKSMRMKAVTQQGGGSRDMGESGVIVTTNGYTVVHGQNVRMSESNAQGTSSSYLGRIVCYPRYTGSGSTYTSSGDVRVYGRLYAQYSTAEFAAINVSGQKNRVVETDDYGTRTLSCYETPTPMFGDVGSGTIGEDGTCVVSIDVVFAETANVNSSYQVFLQKCGPGDLWVADKKPTHFIVEGTPGLWFDWELKARQIGFEHVRLEDVGITDAMTDSTGDYACSLEDMQMNELDSYIGGIEGLYERGVA